jgi:hypothetical protein
MVDVAAAVEEATDEMAGGVLSSVNEIRLEVARLLADIPRIPGW